MYLIEASRQSIHSCSFKEMENKVVHLEGWEAAPGCRGHQIFLENSRLQAKGNRQNFFKAKYLFFVTVSQCEYLIN